jgi:hypothetical protein
MGRAFRVVKRTAHLTVQVSERPQPIIAAPEPAEETPAPKRARGAVPRATAKRKPAARKKASGARKTAGSRKKAGAKKKTAKG